MCGSQSIPGAAIMNHRRIEEESMSILQTAMKHGARSLPFVPKAGPVDRVKALLRAPSLLKLVWYLFQDNRVPVWQKGAALSAFLLVVSPLDVIQAIPVIGEASDVMMAMLILDTFVKVAPAEVVNEHITRLNLQGKIPLRV
jgi:uncharacterized membrane protein YkvA (DUF1232 family)